MLLAIVFVRIPYLPSAISLNLLLAPVGAPHAEIDKSSSFERIEYTLEPITSTSTNLAQRVKNACILVSTALSGTMRSLGLAVSRNVLRLYLG